MKFKRLFSICILTGMLTTISAVHANNTKRVQAQEKKIESEQLTPKAQYGKITANNVHFRSSPGTSSTVYGQLHAGTMVGLPYADQVYKDGLWWTKILYNNRTGWVASKYVVEI